MGIGTVSDRQWQKALGLGAIALSGAAAIAALTDRSRSSNTNEPWSSNPLPPLAPEYANWLPNDRRSGKDRRSSGSHVPNRDLSNALRGEVDRLERELEQSLTRKQQLEAVIGVLRKEKTAIQAQIDEGSSRTQSVYRVLADLEAQRQQLEDKITQRQTQLADLDTQQAAIERDLPRLDRLRDETVILEREILDRQNTIESLRQEERTLLDRCHQLETQVAKLSQQTISLTRSLADTAREQQNVDNTLHQQQQELAQIRAQSDAHHRRRHELRQQIEQLQQQASQLPSEISHLQTERDRLVSECRDRQLQLQQLQQQIAQAQHQSQILKTDIDRQETQRQAIASRQARDGGTLRLWLSLLLKDLPRDQTANLKPRRNSRKS
ncbi:MAG: hypothetical protein EA001_14035 [Oscillatoriales cyanobacterium]|nr:MAG: hypothetical protein EA001_14035 [Oscillatoriales cyanobacterium]